MAWPGRLACAWISGDENSERLTDLADDGVADFVVGTTEADVTGAVQRVFARR